MLCNRWGNIVLWLHSQVFKWKDLNLHVITSLSVSRTYLPINPPVWEALIWGMECDPRQFPEPCVCSGVSLVCLCVLWGNTCPDCPADPERQEQVQPSPPWALPRSGCRALRQPWPVSPRHRYSALLTAWQFITQMKALISPVCQQSCHRWNSADFPM